MVACGTQRAEATDAISGAPCYTRRRVAHRNRRHREALRGAASPQGRVPHARPWAHRPARTQRRRQVHPAQVPHRADRAGLRHDEGLRHRRGPLAVRGAIADRLHARGRRRAPRADGRAVHDARRRAVRLAPRRGDGARASGAALRRPRRGPLPQARQLLHRHAAARAPGAGARGRSQAAALGRAHLGPRSPRPRRDARADPRHPPAHRRERAALDPHPPRRREDLRSGRGGRGR